MRNVSLVDTPAPNMIQELPWTQALQAIQDSIHFDDFDSFRLHLLDNLPYNSPSTRQRHRQTITQYFFPNGLLEILPRQVWQVYHDDEILEDLMRYQYLSHEPTVAHFVVTHLISMTPGDVLEHGVLKGFIQEVDPKNRPGMVKRLGLTLRRMGFIVRERQQDIVVQLRPPENAFLILLHHLFAPTPRIVTLRDILADPFWYYLGFREEGTIRRILHEASARGLIAGYATVDQLEQITTRFTLEAWFDRRLQL